MSLLRKAILVNSAEFVCFAIGLAPTIILTRVLGPAGIGQYSLIASTLQLAAQFCCLGFPLSFLYHSQYDPANTKEYLINAIWVNLVLGIIGGIAVTILIYHKADFFGQLPWFALLATGLFIPIVLQSGIARQSLLIKIEAKKLSILQFSVTIGSFCLVLIFFAFGSLAVGQAILCFVSMAIIRAVVGWYFMKEKVDFSIRPSWNISFKLGLMGIRQSWADLMTLLNSVLSVLIIKYLIKDFESVGFFSRGMQIAMLVVTASQAVFPLLFSRWASLSPEKVAGHVEKVMRFTTTICVIIIVAILLTGKWIIIVMYGKEFLPAVTPMMILLPGTVLYLMSRTLMPLLGSRGSPELSAFVLLLGALINVVFSWILIPSMGINGAALASTAGNIGLLVMLTVIANWKYQVRPMRCLWLDSSDWTDIKTQLFGSSWQNV